MSNQTIILEPGRNAAVSAEINLEPGELYWLGVYVPEGQEMPRDLDKYLQLESKTPGAWQSDRHGHFQSFDGTRLIGHDDTHRVRRKASPQALGVYLQPLHSESMKIVDERTR